MKQTLISMALILTMALYAKAQTPQHSYTITGVVADSVTHEGEPYATLTITRGDSAAKPVKQALTDINGRFSISTSGVGSYLLMVRSMGRKPMQRTYTVDATTRTIDLGTLFLQNGGNELETVEVVAYKPLVKADIDKIAYSVEDDPDAKNNSVMEMLKKVPMVTVDGQDNVQVNGSTAFKVYVNGKPNNMMTKNPKEILKSMPASSIKKIEVITNPGPKYDAEGVGGILNIITTGSGPEGYNASFSAGASNRHVGTGVYATVKQGRLTMSASYNTYPQWQPKTHDNQLVVKTDDDGNEIQRDATTSTERGHSIWHGGNLDASYEIDSLRLLSGSLSISRYHSNYDFGSAVSSTLPTTGERLYGYGIHRNNRANWNGLYANIDYQRSFSVEGRRLTISYRIDSDPSDSEQRLRYTDRYSNADWDDFINRIADQRNTADQLSVEHTFQIDYTTPFAKYHSWETGVKYILRNNRSDNDKYTLAPGQSDETYDSDNSSHYRHRNDILAAYMGYGYEKDKWSARLGLRYEHTLQKVKYLLGRGADFHKDFDDVVPSARLGYKLSETANVALGYKMRIYRPGIWYLNPYLVDRDPQNIMQGNPNLVSEKSHDISLQYSSYSSKLTYSLTASYRFNDNSIESITRLTDDRDIEGLLHPTGKEVLYTTYANIGKAQRAALSAYVNWNPWTDTRITLNGQGGYKSMSDGQQLSNHGWRASVNLGVQQTIAKTWTVSVNIYKTTPEIMLQGKGSAYFEDSYSLNKALMDKRLNLSVFITNPFKGYMTWRDEQRGPNYYTATSSRYSQRMFGVSASLSIGRLKTSVKRAERSVENDDVKQGGGGGKR